MVTRRLSPIESRILNRDGTLLQGNAFMSFADLMMIITVFFAMVLSVSEVRQGNFDQMRADFSGSSAGTLVDLAATLKEMPREHPGVSIHLDDEGVRIEMESAALFETGEAYLKSGALQGLEAVFLEILKTPYRLDVEGHTDDQGFYRLDGREILTNWSLSGRRASSVVLHLLELGFPESRLRIVGYAATRARVKIDGLSGDDLMQARAMNRRVTVLVR